MPQSDSDRADSDPLLEFLSELEAAASTPQPVEKTELPAVAAPVEAPPDRLDPLRERMEKLEQALGESTEEVAALRAQVATLVRATRDIDRRVDKAAVPPAPVPITNLRSNRSATAIVGTIFGIALTAWLWGYATTNRSPIVMPAQAASPAAPVDPPPPAEATPPPAEPAKSPVRVSAPPRAEPQQAPPRAEPQKAPARTGYVGTLSIDASPEGQVLVNGRDAGRTPLRLENLKAGAHLIWIERDGYRRWTKVVDVPAGKISRVFADLEPIASR